MFGFRSRIGYQNIEDESTPSQICLATNEQTLLIPERTVPYVFFFYVIILKKKIALDIAIK